MSAAAWTALAPFVVLAALFVAHWIATRSWNISSIAEGTDGRISTSKTQFLLWTAVVIPCYACLFVANWRGAHHVDAGLGVPANLMAALGISVLTTTGAKALYLVGSAPKEKAGAAGKGGLLTDDSGHPELAKIQLMGWTLLAIAIFCVRVASHAKATVNGAAVSTTMPDVDTALLVLMGIGHAGYTAKKALDRVQTKSQPLHPAPEEDAVTTADEKAPEAPPVAAVQ
jgi:hypothetical protein